jgi:8-oxo-dGTP diphosphatase
MAISESIPAFGRRVPDQEYVPRPSAYVVVRDPQGRFAVVKTPIGVFLPGGGLRPDETPEEAAARESAEECGLRVETSTLIGVADQYVYSAPEETFFAKRSTFVRASVTGSVASSEADHTLCWLSAQDAERSLSHESHRWAVRGGTPPYRGLQLTTDS